MRVVRKQLRQVPPWLYKKMYSLNLRDEGSMQGKLSGQYQWRQCRVEGEKETIVHYILDGTKLIGWALLFYNYFERKMYCQLYVRKNERRKGYGKRLLRANIKYVRQLRRTFKVIHSSNNKGFFKKLKKYSKGSSEPLNKFS